MASELKLNQTTSHSDDFSSEKDVEKNSFNASNGAGKEPNKLEKEMGLVDDGDGTTKRGMKQRHLSMIALGGTIGTGLFVGLGSAISSAGPVSTLIGYALMGLVVYALMVALGEMGTQFPVAGGFVQFATRWLEPGWGFSIGWSYWFCYGITLPTEISASAIIIRYWDVNEVVPSAVWITILLLLTVGVNVAGVKYFGEFEFWFALIKVLAIVILIIVGIVIDLGGGPNQGRIGFRNWVDLPMAQLFWYPDPVTNAPMGGISGSLGRFLAFWRIFVNAAFSFAGTEIIGVALSEVQNPRKNVPKAIARVFWRILLFYVLAIFVVGLIVPYNDPRLLTESSDASASPFVIAVDNAGIRVLPHLINAVLIVATWSAANSDLYASSRSLWGLSLSHQAPLFLRRCTANGVPIWSVLFTSLFGPLAYMGIGSVGAAKAFTILYNLSAISSVVVWVIILGTYLRFYYGFKAQTISRDALHYKAPFQPWASWIAFVFLIVVLLFADFTVFMNGRWDVASFLTSYLAGPIAILLWVGFKIVKKSKILPLKELDFSTGLRKLEQEDEETKTAEPTTVIGKVWDFLM